MNNIQLDGCHSPILVPTPSSIHPSKRLVPWSISCASSNKREASWVQVTRTWTPRFNTETGYPQKLETTSCQTAQSLHTTYHTALWSNLVNRCEPNSNQETMIAFNLAVETSHLFAKFMSNQIGTAFTCRVLRWIHKDHPTRCCYF